MGVSIRYFSTIVAVFCLLGLLRPAVVEAGVTSHNGSSAAPSNPTGTDSVPVVFVGDAEAATGFLVVAIAFFDNVTHTFDYSFESPEPPVLFVDFAVVNNTTEAWTSYGLSMSGVDFFGLVDPPPYTRGDLATAVDPIDTFIPDSDEIFMGIDPSTYDITVAGSSITRFGDDATLTINFDHPVDPGELFSLAFFIDDVGATDASFTMSQTPNATVPIPAPGAAILGLLGFGTLGAMRRRLYNRS